MIKGKKCVTCNKTKTDGCFYKRYNTCKLCVIERTKKYCKTYSGYILKSYHSMKQRTLGKLECFARWKGKELLPKSDFIKWTENNAEFLNLFKAWTLSGYQKKLSPSINRLDNNLGYVLSNMEWIPHGENARRACIARKGMKYKTLGAKNETT